MTYSERNFVDGAQPGALQANISSSVVSFVVTGGVFPPTPFVASLDWLVEGSEELVYVTANVAGTWTVTRGYDTITPLVAQSHSASAVVMSVGSAIDLIAMNGHDDHPTGGHVQYLDAAGVRHDLPFLHPNGTVIPVAIPTGTLDFGQSPSIGVATDYAASGHVHAAPGIEPLVGGLYQPGGMILWPSVSPIPQGWLPCDGREILSTAAPATFTQWGYTAGGAIDWYPPAPVILRSPTGALDIYAMVEGQFSSYALVAPPTNRWWFRLPQTIPSVVAAQTDPLGLSAQQYNPLSSLEPGWPLGTSPAMVSWIIKLDSSYTYDPRPQPPAPVPMSYYDPVTATYTPSPYTWGFDATTGIPVIFGGPGPTTTTISTTSYMNPTVWYYSGVTDSTGLDLGTIDLDSYDGTSFSSGSGEDTETWTYTGNNGYPFTSESSSTSPGASVLVGVPVYPNIGQVPSGMTVITPPS